MKKKTHNEGKEDSMKKKTHNEGKENNMKKETHNEMNDDLRPEYDLPQLLRDGARGKYVERFRAGYSITPLTPDASNVR